MLLVIHNDPTASQQKIAELTDMSSSMVNNYIKEHQKNKLVTVTGNTNRTTSYHLSASGRNMLISSLLSYSTDIVQIYGAAKRELSASLNKINSHGVNSITLFGAAETCEVVHAAIKETPLKVVAILDNDRNKQGKPFNGLIIQPPELLRQIEFDAVVITSFGKQEEIYKNIIKIRGSDKNIIKLTDLYEV